MTRIAMLLCLLTGCASGPAYRRGAGVPTAPVFEPSLDAPHTTGQPGYLHPEVKRSPDKRILPVREESTVYASDGGEKKRVDEDLPELPMPDEAELACTHQQWDVCVYMVRSLVTPPYSDRYSPHLREYIRVLTPKQRACLRERLMRSCIADSLREPHVLKLNAPTADGIAPDLMRALQRRINVACEGIPMDYRSVPVGVLALDLGSFGYQLRWDPSLLHGK